MVAVFLIVTRTKRAEYVQLHPPVFDEKITANGPLDGSFIKSQQSSTGESFKRYGLFYKVF